MADARNTALEEGLAFMVPNRALTPGRGLGYVTHPPSVALSIVWTYLTSSTWKGKQDSTVSE
jgi:hypothetical protein